MRREPEKFRPAQRARAPFFAVVGLGVVAILLKGSGWEVWLFTVAVVLLPIPFYVWTRRAAPATLLGRDGLSVEASLVGGTIVRALLRAERVHAAMLARGYDGRIDPWLPNDQGAADAA